MKYWTSPTQLRVIANGILNGPINYGILNWIQSKPNLIEQLEVIREKAARVILGITKVYKLGRTEVLKKVGWMTLYQFAEAQKYSHIHRTLITGKPLQLFRELTDNRTREQATAKQIYSKTRSKYNEIPIEIRQLHITGFRFHYKKYLLNNKYRPNVGQVGYYSGRPNHSARMDTDSLTAAPPRLTAPLTSLTAPLTSGQTRRRTR